MKTPQASIDRRFVPPRVPSLKYSWSFININCAHTLSPGGHISTPCRQQRRARDPAGAMSDDPDALLVRADKKMVTTLTRWKPDYDAAAQLYEEAGGKFRALGRKRDAMIALEKCAHANAQTGDDWHAARCLEQCASLAKDVGTPANIVDYAERARDAYALANRQQRGAEAVGKIASFLDELDPDAACRLYDSAVRLLEDDDKHIYCADFYRGAAAVRVRQERFDEAAQLMMRFGACCDVAGSVNSQRKAYLSAVVASLLGGDAEDAQATYADVSDVPNFQNSDEQRAAYRLLTAYRDADADADSRRRVFVRRVRVSRRAVREGRQAIADAETKPQGDEREDGRGRRGDGDGGGFSGAKGGRGGRRGGRGERQVRGRRRSHVTGREGWTGREGRGTGRATGSRTTTISRDWARALVLDDDDLA